MMKIEELRNLGPEELREKESSLRKELMQLRFQAKTGKLERQGAIRETRRTIARLLTVANELNREGAVKTAPATPVKKVKAVQPKAEEKKAVKKKPEAKAVKAPAKAKKGK